MIKIKLLDIVTRLDRDSQYKKERVTKDILKDSV